MRISLFSLFWTIAYLDFSSFLLYSSRYNINLSLLIEDSFLLYSSSIQHFVRHWVAPYILKRERRTQIHAMSGKAPPHTQTILSIHQHDSGVTNLSAAFIQDRAALRGTAFILGTGIRLRSQITTTVLAMGGYNFPRALTKPANSIM